MEIAIPLLALGGMYVVSNNRNQSTKNEIKNGRNETFSNMGKPANSLPNTNIPPRNFPMATTDLNDLNDDVNLFSGQTVETENYLNQTAFQRKVKQGQDPSKFQSLSGNFMTQDEFKHNNMVPFNGGKVRGQTYDMNANENVLDSMAGTGSQTIRKAEQGPLFKPEENVNWTYGMPNQSDFIQSRVVPGMKNNNVKPFDTVRVGPGLDKGYGISGSNGFNSGMESRDKWMPKNVDELRVATNPKLEYTLDGHEGPANSFIKNASSTQMLGRVEKQRPDTYFINTQDRWFTTTGAQKGETLRSQQELGIIRRNSNAVNYAGPAGAVDIKATYAPENFEPSKRNEVLEGCINPSSAVGRGPSEDTERFLKSHSNYSNNRSTTTQNNNFGSAFSGAIGAVIAPILDAFRPTRKEETVENMRVYGEAGSAVPKQYVYNPQDTAPTTIKETTLHSRNFYINNQKEGIYVNTHTAPDLTQRNTTSCEYYNSAGGAATGYGDRNYEAAYRQHNNDIKAQTIYNRPNQGGTQIFNQQMHMNCSKSDCDRLDGRMNPAFSKTSALPPSVDTYGSMHKQPQKYDNAIMNDRINPDILSAFKDNPYTHSLTGIA
jgi:hypothetical protein